MHGRLIRLLCFVSVTILVAAHSDISTAFMTDEATESSTQKSMPSPPANAGPVPSPSPLPSPSPSASPSPAPVADPIVDKVRASTAKAKTEKSMTGRLKIVDDLRSLLDEANQVEEPSVSAIRYQVSLEPLFERKTDLGSQKVCGDIREQIIFKFASGTGFSGTLPDFVLDSLKFLAAACRNESLATPPKPPKSNAE